MLAALGVTSIAQDSKIDLSWNPQEGATSVYKINTTMMMDFGGGEMEMAIAITTSSKYVSITDKEVKAEGEVTEFFMTVDGQEMDPTMGGGESPVGQKETTTFDRTGKFLSTTAEGDGMDGGPRVQRLSEFRYPSEPIAMGGEWMVDYPADQANDVPEGKAKFTLEKETTWKGKPVYQVKHVYSEMTGNAPTGAIQTVWLDKVTKEVVKTEGEWQNVQFVPMMPPTTAKVVFEKVN